MYRVDKIKELSTLIGWRQNFDSTSFQIGEELTESDSGEYFQDIHPLLTLDNIKSIAPKFDCIEFPEWDGNETYEIGSRVLRNSISYVALAQNTSSDPELDDQNNPTTWLLFDAFSDWLKQKTESSIIRAVKNIYTEKLSKEAAKSLMQSKVLFDGSGRIGNLEQNRDNFVGFEIIPIRGMGVTLKIDKIGTQFTGGIEDLTLHLFHSSSLEPIKTITLERTKNDTFEWFVPSEDIYLPYMDSNDAGGSWYLIYGQSQLSTGVQAIQKEKDWSKRPCSTCSRERHDYNYWMLWSKWLEVHPFRTGETSNPSLLWDIESNLYTYNTNYGLNLKLSVHCDISDLIVDQAVNFQTLIGLQVANDFIREMAYNPEYNINRTQQNFTKMELLYELDGDSQSYKKSGLKHDLDKAIKATSLDLNSMSRVCFTCKKNGPKYKSAVG